jgi:uncharacterized membrane protein
MRFLLALLGYVLLLAILYGIAEKIGMDQTDVLPWFMLILVSIHSNSIRQKATRESAKRILKIMVIGLIIALILYVYYRRI